MVQSGGVHNLSQDTFPKPPPILMVGTDTSRKLEKQHASFTQNANELGKKGENQGGWQMLECNIRIDQVEGIIFKPLKIWPGKKVETDSLRIRIHNTGLFKECRYQLDTVYPLKVWCQSPANPAGPTPEIKCSYPIVERRQLLHALQQEINFFGGVCFCYQAYTGAVGRRLFLRPGLRRQLCPAPHAPVKLPFLFCVSIPGRGKKLLLCPQVIIRMILFPKIYTERTLHL